MNPFRDGIRDVVARAREALAGSSTRPPANRCAMHPDDFDELRASMTAADGDFVGSSAAARFMGLEVYTDPAVERGSVRFDRASDWDERGDFVR